MGGVAAALAAARRGCRTCLLEETDWLGGQLSAQGVSALDEHEHIEAFGGTASYYALREALRDHYRGARRRRRPPPRLQPGRLLGDAGSPSSPRSARRRCSTCSRRIVASGRLQIFLRSKTVAVDDRRRPDPLAGRARPRHRPTIRFRAAMVIDATELGDLLPLAGAEYRVGAESVAETGEAHAQPHEAKAHCVQSFTYTFAAERRPEGERHVIPEPAKYRHYREAQPYSLTIDVHGGEIYGEESGRLEYRLYDRMPGTKGGLWTYRRLLAARALRRAAAARPDDVQLARQRLPRPQHHRPARGRGRGQPAGRQAGEPRLPALAADRGADHRRSARRARDHAAARRDGQRPTASRSIPTSASRGASSP